MRRATSVLLLVTALLAGSCSDAADARSITVFASASLTEAMQQIVAGYQRAHPESTVRLHCAGTPHLLMQAHQGARVDVFAAADRASMERFAASTPLAAAPTVLARNALAIVVPAGNPHGLTGLCDLQRADLLVAVCGPRVPAGAYARTAFTRAGVVVRSCSDESSVKAVVAKVRLGEFDAGVVYATDVRGVAGVEAVPIAAESNVEVELCIAVIAAGRSAAAGEFVAWALGAAGRHSLGARGFALP